MEGLIRVTPDKEKAKSIIKMARITLELIKTIDMNKFPSNAVKEYYDTARELISAVALLDGLKTQGEGAHKKLIEYLKSNYDEFQEHEIILLEELRTIRNKIAYDGFFVKPDYLNRNKESIESLIEKLQKLAEKGVFSQ
ncbi:hypothetical protein HYU12_02420 [Candidatus Woesearchaeota archaeon]|nr:hypothetical protein [Candidatus Woesearchaeota archaeon]